MKARSHGLNVGMLVILSVTWAIGFVCIEISDGTIPPLTLMALRSGIGSVCLLVVCALMGRPLRQAGWTFPAYWLTGLFMVALPWPMLAWSEDYIDAGLASLLTTVTPMGTFVITAWILHTDHSRWYRLVGMAVCILGLALAIGILHLWEAKVSFLGLGLTVGAFLFYALNGICVAHFNKGKDPLVTCGFGIFYGAVLVTIAAFIFERPLEMEPSVKDIWAMLFLAIPTVVVGYALYYVLIDRAGAFFASTWGYLVPALGIVFSGLILGTPLGWQHIVGTVLVIGGVYLVNLRPKGVSPGAEK